jgi:hypothetical protein
MLAVRFLNEEQQIELLIYNLNEMKAKINKQCLLKANGFYIENRYSSNGNTDDMGRWARIVYYNGFCIAWINGFVRKGAERIEPRTVGIVDFFTASMLFPCSANQGGATEKFDNIEDAIKYSKEMFFDFRRLVNK